MKYYNKLKKAFTLVEITIAILVVAVLVLLCMPIVNNQMRKTEEYSYFAAYKLVEKIAAQVLVYGDENDNLAFAESSKNMNNVFIPPAMAQFYNSETEFMNHLSKSPTPPNIVTNFTESEWNYAALCAGKASVNSSGGLYSYTIETITPSGKCSLYGTGNPGPYGTFAPNIFSLARFSGNRVTQNQLLDNLKNMAAQQHCMYLGNQIDSDKYDSYYVSLVDDSSAANPTHECIVVRQDPLASLSTETATVSTPVTGTSVTNCDNAHGYIEASGGFISPSGTTCVCSGAWAVNNPRVCCPNPGDGNLAYYDGTQNCVSRAAGTRNESTVAGSNCPTDATYSPSSRSCVCNDGFNLNASNCVRNAVNCPPGTHLSNSSCVINAPFLKAKRFCEKVNSLWNTKSHLCDTFTEDGQHRAVYTAVYNAATNDGSYLSVNATEGAFSDIRPNLVFANGMRMWILGDRAASIPGLSYNPDEYTDQSHTICQLVDNITVGACSVPNFFCRDEGRCYSVTTSADGPRLVDARNCCASPDKQSIVDASYAGGSYDYRLDSRIYAISGFTVFVDIDGAGKGSSTLWDDIFPFYISTDGEVYPGYPLNAGNTRLKYIGGNSSYLNVDVYYYSQSGDNRVKTYVDRSIPMARALCLTKKISVKTPYCRNLGESYRKQGNYTTIDKYVEEEYPCHNQKCFIHLKNKVKFL